MEDSTVTWLFWHTHRYGSLSWCFTLDKYYWITLHVLSCTRCNALNCLCHLYVVSTLKWAAARSVGGIHAGREFPETHLVHSKSPGSTRTFSLPSCCRPVYTNVSAELIFKLRDLDDMPAHYIILTIVNMIPFLHSQRVNVLKTWSINNSWRDLSYLSGCSVQFEHIARRESSTQNLSLCYSLIRPHLEKHIHSWLAHTHIEYKAPSISFRLVTHQQVEPAWIQTQWWERPCHNLSCLPTAANWEACSGWNAHIYLQSIKITHTVKCKVVSVKGASLSLVT